MEVYEFDKCLLDRLEESMSVLSWKGQGIPASQVRAEWSYYIELQIEPAGWQAFWKIPRVICEELHLRFPTVVFGVVEQVLFKELKAVFVVEAVQDNDVHLPAKHEVSLEDLWPTKIQENTELIVDRTADCLDRLRFFYTHVWMPWDYDNDDDLNWVEKHLESRIRFCYDLRKRSIKRALAAHIRTLLTEAKYIQQRREYLELGLSDDEDLDNTLDKSQITDLMRLHLRLAMIRSEIEILENPEMRRIYEEIKFDDEKYLKDAKNNTSIHGQLHEKVSERIYYAVMLPCTLERQMELLHFVQQCVPKNCLMQMYPSLQDVLSVCSASDSIFLSPGRHTIKFLEYLNDNGNISGINNRKITVDNSVPFSSQNAIITSADDDSILLLFDGHFNLENLILDCQNIRCGISVKNGRVYLKNCHLIGDGKSSTQEGIMCSGCAEIILENCIVENFATGIILNSGAKLTLNNTNIKNCTVGLDVSASDTKVNLKKAIICDSQKCGIIVDSINIAETDSKYLVLQELNDLNQYACSTNSSFSGECNFKNCKANICVINGTKLIVSEESRQHILTDSGIVDSQNVNMSTSPQSNNDI